jgi:hypothetical protein
VSFLVVSAFAVSTLTVVSVLTVVESVVAAGLLPEQAAKETVKAKAKAPNLIEFFILLVFKVIK